MTSPDPADHPLPISPDPNISPIATVPLALPPDTPTPDFTVPPSLSSDSKSNTQETESLIASLRTSLTTAQNTISTQTTRLSSLSDVETALAQLKDQYAFLSAAKEAVEAQLQEEIKKREVAEENVEMLRGQVEQARRGVMTLQKQEADRKRMSTISGGLGLGLQGQAGEEEILSSIEGSSSNSNSNSNTRESKLVKRQSMMRSHRRQSSQSEPSDILDRTSHLTSPNLHNNQRDSTLRPGGQGLRELRLGHTSPSTSATANTPSPNFALSGNPNSSGYFDDPTTSEPPSSIQSKNIELPSKKEIEAIEEASRLKGELAAMQNKLEESEEARMASEVCLKALREFMASNSSSSSGGEGGIAADGEMSGSTADLLKGIRLPPLPTDRDADEEQRNREAAAEAEAERARQAAGASGWGFKLWNNASKSPAANPVSSPGKEHLSPQHPQKSLSPPNRSRAGSSATVSPLPTPSSEDLPTPTSGLTASTTSQTPLSSFVSSWTKGAGVGVTSPPANNTPSGPSSGPGSNTTTGERPSNARKISVTNFFSRGKKEVQPQPQSEPGPVKEENEGEKELPLPPVEANKGNAELEPSPEISTKQLVFDGNQDDRDRRVSRGTTGTTVTELEEELGTPQSSLKGVAESEDEDQLSKLLEANAKEGEMEKEKEKEKMDEIAL
ncbi:uncharacterized protein I303_103050 [Kwoniella dejecticola CBS 10117]|uniref:Uncharacterized protein n=1 Tax=Kwoniella dejecticola CBS 10117 TaxID=1296121 RepID=A0A1A6AAF6_9TREE|nr:uncharacterized protein I303_03070 [Kwoniella dejecticola CBS 10117]OBR87047.1 hypothetical protein I303_03070 [Kwoniella dejecticola CBS 10117]